MGERRAMRTARGGYGNGDGTGRTAARCHPGGRRGRLPRSWSGTRTARSPPSRRSARSSSSRSSPSTRAASSSSWATARSSSSRAWSTRCAAPCDPAGHGRARGGLPEAERIRFRIGINLGDVIHEADGDLYGDGVNVAARLEQLAEPGGIVVSGTAYDHLQGKLDLPLEFAGEQKLKNIDRPVRAYRVPLGWVEGPAASGAVWRAASLSSQRRCCSWQQLPAAAVVAGPARPCERPALSGGAALRERGRGRGDRPARRRPQRRHRHRSRPIPEHRRHRPELGGRLRGQVPRPAQLGKDLGVGNVLTGSIQRQGDSIRVERAAPVHGRRQGPLERSLGTASRSTCSRCSRRWHGRRSTSSAA